MRDAGHEDGIEVGEHRVERFTVLGRLGRQPGPDLARRDRRQHREGFEPFVVAGDPLDHLVAVPAEFVRRHVRAHGVGVCS